MCVWKVFRKFALNAKQPDRICLTILCKILRAIPEYDPVHDALKVLFILHGPWRQKDGQSIISLVGNQLLCRLLNEAFVRPDDPLMVACGKKRISVVQRYLVEGLSAIALKPDLRPSKRRQDFYFLPDDVPYSNSIDGVRNTRSLGQNRIVIPQKRVLDFDLPIDEYYRISTQAIEERGTPWLSRTEHYSPSWHESKVLQEPVEFLLPLVPFLFRRFDCSELAGASTPHVHWGELDDDTA